MKNLIVISVFLLVANFINAQQFSVPEVTQEQTKEILYNHVIAYCATGITYAKSQGTTPKEYGEYVGTQFKSFWNPDDGFSAFANGMMYLLCGIHPDNDMQIVEQSDKMIHFKMKNVDLAFNLGPAYGVTYEEFLECSEGILNVLADYMGVSFSHRVTDKVWYNVKLNAK